MGCVSYPSNYTMLPPLLQAEKLRSGAIGGYDGEREWRNIDYGDRGDAMVESSLSFSSSSFTTRNMSTCDHHYWSLKGHCFSFVTFF